MTTRILLAAIALTMSFSTTANAQFDVRLPARTGASHDEVTTLRLVDLRNLQSD